MHGLDAGSAQVGFEAQVEIGRIHANEHIRPILQQARSQLLANAQMSRNRRSTSML
jgi:hypothetical protein